MLKKATGFVEVEYCKNKITCVFSCKKTNLTNMVGRSDFISGLWDQFMEK